MKTSKFSESQRLAIISKQGSGMTIEEICREHQISPATFHKWKKELADDQNFDKLRLKKLEQENARLKKMYTELKMDHDILQEGYSLAKKILNRSPKKP
jgi:putative transposase